MTEMFTSMTAMAAGILAIVAFIKNTFNTNGLITDIISWAISIPLALIAWWLGWGMFADITWYIAILYGVLASFYANKGWDFYSVIFGKKDINYENK